MSTLSSYRDDLIMVKILPHPEKTHFGSTLQRGEILNSNFRNFLFSMLRIIDFVISNFFYRLSEQIRTFFGEKPVFTI
jgi:hypothetical protein